MKKFIYIFLTLFAFAFTACEKSEADGPTGQLVVENESVYTLKVSVSRKGSFSSHSAEIIGHGNYIFFGLPEGSYFVNYSKSTENRTTTTTVVAGQKNKLVLHWY